MSLCVVCVCVCVHMNVCQYTFGKIWSPYLDKATTPASAALPVPTSVCSIFVCSNSGMAANICDFHSCWCMRLHTGSVRTPEREYVLTVDSGRTIPYPVSCWGIEPASALRLEFWSDALPTKQSCPSERFCTFGNLVLNVRRNHTAYQGQPVHLS